MFSSRLAWIQDVFTLAFYLSAPISTPSILYRWVNAFALQCSYPCQVVVTSDLACHFAFRAVISLPSSLASLFPRVLFWKRPFLLACVPSWPFHGDWHLIMTLLSNAWKHNTFMCTYSHVNLPYCGLTQINPLTIWKQYVIFTSRPAEQLNEVVTFVFTAPFRSSSSFLYSWSFRFTVMLDSLYPCSWKFLKWERLNVRGNLLCAHFSVSVK